MSMLLLAQIKSGGPLGHGWKAPPRELSLECSLDTMESFLPPTAPAPGIFCL